MNVEPVGKSGESEKEPVDPATKTDEQATPNPSVATPLPVEITLDETASALFDSAYDAKQAKIAPIEAEYNKVVQAANARYSETVMRVLSRHGLKRLPKMYTIELRDGNNNLIIPAKFKYMPEPDLTTQNETPAPEKKIKPWEKLRGQKHGSKR